MIILVDGSSLLTTSFYSSVPKEFYRAKTEEEWKEFYPELLHSPDGQCVNGVLNFMRSMENFLDIQNPDYIAVCFDKTRNTFRRDLYPEYKGNRGAKPEALSEQFNIVQDLLSDAGICVIDSDNYEADDLVGTLARIYGENGEKVRLFTKDQDYFQLVNDKNDVKLWLWMNDEKVQELGTQYGFPSEPVPFACYEFDEEKTLKYYGVTPEQVPDKKGLTGDTADNIPGVKGVGEKAAIPLLKEYGTVEKLYEAIHASTDDTALENYWKTIGLSRRGALPKLKSDEDMAYLSKKLATIKTDCDFPDIEVLKDTMSTEYINFDVLDEWYNKLGIYEAMNETFENDNENDDRDDR